eukprot:COSAG02_NODE_503_length_20999_cov_7.403110_3_plen_274_part_00
MVDVDSLGLRDRAASEDATLVHLPLRCVDRNRNRLLGHGREQWCVLVDGQLDKVLDTSRSLGQLVKLALASRAGVLVLLRRDLTFRHGVVERKFSGGALAATSATTLLGVRDAVDELLRREHRQLPGLDRDVSLDRFGRGESPARATAALVFDRREHRTALRAGCGTPVHGVGERLRGSGQDVLRSGGHMLVDGHVGHVPLVVRLELGLRHVGELVDACGPGQVLRVVCMDLCEVGSENLLAMLGALLGVLRHEVRVRVPAQGVSVNLSCRAA